MNGLYADQKVWVNYGGTCTLATMNDLWEAYLDGSITQYKAYCFDPYQFMKKPEDRDKMIYQYPIWYVINYHMKELMTVATEDGETVVLSSSGHIMDVAEYAPAKDTRPAPKLGIDDRCFVSALTEFQGEPGEVQIVRRVVDCAIGHGCLMTCPVPNLIAESGFVVLT
ncbi:MAG: hypothetical protein K2F99_04700 [Muribaculaceae bacterium]|nr:hypothetical protein [Muribaculaceae bacterium]